MMVCHANRTAPCGTTEKRMYLNARSPIPSLFPNRRLFQLSVRRADCVNQFSQVRRTCPSPSRMLKKSGGGVLTSLRGSTRVFGSRNHRRAFPFAKIDCTDERPHEVRSVPPRLFARCGLAWDKTASRRARVGRARSPAFLSILQIIHVSTPRVSTHLDVTVH